MYEDLLTRRSVRKYSDRPVEEEKLDKVLTAGLYAPTGMNNQAPVMVAVRDKETRDKLSRMNAAVMGASGDPFYGAPCVIVVLSDPERMTWVEDGSLVLGNLMNAAHSLGLGSCWIHRAKEEFEMDWGKELLKSLGIEEEYEGIGHCALGYVEGEYPKTPARKPNRVFYVK